MANIIKLCKGEFYRFKEGDSRFTLRVEAGMAWVTYRGCITDFILEAGDIMPESKGEELLIECMSDELVLTEVSRFAAQLVEPEVEKEPITREVVR